MNRHHRHSHSALAAVLAVLRERGITVTVEPGRGSHAKVRWNDGQQQMLVVPKDSGERHQRKHLLAQLTRKLEHRESSRYRPAI
jgi:hypothetical protein